MTSSPVTESRAPVGSSASTSRRGADERAGDGDALLLAAGELGGEPVGHVAEPDVDQRVERFLPRLCAPHAVELPRQRHVLGGGQRRDEVELLEDVADAAASGSGAVRAAERAEVLPGDRDGAGGRDVEAAEQVQERRLARARRAHDGDQLAEPDVEVDVDERADLRRSGPVHAGQAAGGHERRVRGSSGHLVPGRCAASRAVRTGRGGERGPRRGRASGPPPRRRTRGCPARATTRGRRHPVPGLEASEVPQRAQGLGALRLDQPHDVDAGDGHGEGELDGQLVARRRARGPRGSPTSRRARRGRRR